MAIPAGLAGQLGVKAESEYGTAVTVDRFYEFNNEAFDVDVLKLDSTGIGTGRFLKDDRVKTMIRGARGTVELDVMNKDFGLLFQHMLGSNTVTGDGDDKTHTVVPDAAALSGKSLTVQVGRPGTGGTVHPFTFAGGKVSEWELAAALDEILKLTLTLDFASVVTNTALASASYTATREPFVFSEGAVTIGGSTAHVRAFSLRGNNSLNLERRFLGNVKKEPQANGLATFEGTLDMEFEDLTAYAAWVGGTQAALVATFTSPTEIDTGKPFKLTVTVPKIEYMGETPKVGGPEMIMTPRPFRALYDGSNPIVKLEYVTTDTAA